MSSTGSGIYVVDGDRHSTTFGAVIDLISNEHLGVGDGADIDSVWFHLFALDAAAQRIYVWTGNVWSGFPHPGGLGFVAVDPVTKQLLASAPLPNEFADMGPYPSVLGSTSGRMIGGSTRQ